jgi:hypothetical protein
MTAWWPIHWLSWSRHEFVHPLSIRICGQLENLVTVNGPFAARSPPQGAIEPIKASRARESSPYSAWQCRAQHLLLRLPPLPGVVQNDTAAMIIDDAPFLDLLDRAKTAEADEIVVQAAISNARGLSGSVDITHFGRVRTTRLRIGSHTRTGIRAIHHRDREESIPGRGS